MTARPGPRDLNPLPTTPAPSADAGARQRAREQLDHEAAEIVAVLRSAGLEISDLDDLVNTRMDYRKQIPVILDWLSRCDNRTLRLTLVRALTIPAARRTAAPRVLLREFEQAPDALYGWVVGNALGTVATAAEAPRLLDLFREQRYGIARQELARAIARLRPPEALRVLLAGLDDDDVAGHCVEALGALGDPAAVPHLQRMTAHPTAWISNAASAAIRRLRQNAGHEGEA